MKAPTISFTPAASLQQRDALLVLMQWVIGYAKGGPELSGADTAGLPTQNLFLFLLTQGPDFVGGSNAPGWKLDFPASLPDKSGHMTNFQSME